MMLLGEEEKHLCNEIQTVYGFQIIRSTKGGKGIGFQ